MSQEPLPAGHEDIGKPGSSPHVDVTNAQPAPIEATETPGQRLQKLMDQLNHSANLDLQSKLQAMQTAINGLLQHQLGMLPPATPQHFSEQAPAEPALEA